MTSIRIRARGLVFISAGLVALVVLGAMWPRAGVALPQFDWIESLAGAGRGGFASGDVTGVVRLWEVSTRRSSLRISAHDAPIRSIAVSQAGGVIASGAHDGTIRLWDTTTGQLLKQLNAGSSLRCIDLSAAADLLLSVEQSGVVRIWDVESTGEIAKLDLKARAVAGAFVDDKPLVVVAGSKVVVWNYIDLSVESIDGVVAVNALAVENGTVYVAGPTQIDAIDIASLKIMQRFKTGYPPQSMAISDTGKELAIAWGKSGIFLGWSGGVNVIDLTTGEPILEASNWGVRANACCFVPGTRMLAVGYAGSSRSLQLMSY